MPLIDNSTSLYSIPKGRVGPGTGYKYSPFIDSLLSPLKNDYVHQSLENENFIRLLHLHPGTGMDPIACSLVSHSFLRIGSAEAPRQQESYEALSYVWGSDEPTNMIRILSVRRSPERSGRHRVSFRDFELRRYYVRSNIFAALRHLRNADRTRVLWVDALCIDQSNIAERNLQVARMSEIYGNAEKVLVWLGEAADSSNLAFAFIDRVLGVERLDELVEDENTLDMWHALTNLMRRTWFSQRRVVQELALAKRALMQCGEDTVEWEKFSDAVGLFDMKFDDIVQLYVGSKMQGEIESMIYVRALSGAYRLVDVLGNLFRRSESGEIKERLLNLEYLVLNLPSFEVRDPRDTIYALLSLARDTNHTPDLSPANFNSFEVNYQKSIIAVFRDFVAFSIRRSGSLDIICRHWAPPAGEKLPSWMSPVSKGALGIREDSHYVRLNADSLVDQQYAASRQSKASVFFGTDNVYSRSASESDATMYVKGFRLDSIGDTTTVAEEGYIRSDWFEKGCATTDGVPSVTEAFWRTLVANRGSDGKAPPAWYRLACRHVMNERKAGHLNISELIEDLRPVSEKGSEPRMKRKRRPTIERNPSLPRSMPEGETALDPQQQNETAAPEPSGGVTPVVKLRQTSEATVKYLERVQRVAWNRKFLITAANRTFGLGPAQAQKDDVVCILFGCSVPVLLRRRGQFPDCYHEVIGECYIYGMMDGEAMDGVACRDTEIFTLR